MSTCVVSDKPVCLCFVFLSCKKEGTEVAVIVNLLGSIHKQYMVAQENETQTKNIAYLHVPSVSLA